ncbi:MAG: hypothetical protein U0441_11545 [Polyangiaceae bacterium]
MSRPLAGTALFAGVSCALASACASAPPAVEPAPSATVTSAPAPTVTATATATAEAAPVEEPIRKLTLPDAACRLEAPDSDGDGTVFKLSPGGAPFAQAGSGTFGLIGILGSSWGSKPPEKMLEVLLFAGQARSFGVTFQTKRLRVSGYADADAVGLHVQKPAVVGGFLVVVGVYPRRIGADGIEVEPLTNGEISFEAEIPSLKLSCADLAITNPWPRALESVPKLPKKLERFSILGMGTPIPLSLTPGGKAVAELRPNEEGEPVFVLEKRGKATRITWEAGGVTAFGWVPASAIVTTGSRGPVPPMMAPKPPVTKARVACDKDVALIAEARGERLEVGVIKAGAPIDVLEEMGSFARIAPSGPPSEGPFASLTFPDVTPDAKAALLVRASEIAGCPAPPPPPEKKP